MRNHVTIQCFSMKKTKVPESKALNTRDRHPEMSEPDFATTYKRRGGYRQIDGVELGSVVGFVS
jgi:hypothetical protein